MVLISMQNWIVFVSVHGSGGQGDNLNLDDFGAVTSSPPQYGEHFLCSWDAKN